MHATLVDRRRLQPFGLISIYLFILSQVIEERTGRVYLPCNLLPVQAGKSGASICSLWPVLFSLGTIFWPVISTQTISLTCSIFLRYTAADLFTGFPTDASLATRRHLSSGRFRLQGESHKIYSKTPYPTCIDVEDSAAMALRIPRKLVL